MIPVFSGNAIPTHGVRARSRGSYGLFSYLLLPGCLLLLLLSAPVFADIQQLKVTGIAAQQGLSQNTVNTIMQDNHGFIWFGTQDGLNRYDGYAMKIYRSDPSSLNSLSSAHITDIIQDPDGVIWVGTNGAGLNRFNPDTEQYTRYIHSPSDNTTISHNLINTLYLDKQGILWIGTDNGGINRFDTRNETFARYTHNPGDTRSLASNQIYDISGDEDGTIWLATPAGLDRFVPETGVFTHYIHSPDNPESLDSNQTIKIMPGEEKTLWVLTPTGVNLLNPQTGSSTHYLFDIPATDSGSGLKEGALVQSPTGIIWIGTRGSGLRSLDPKTGEITTYPSDQPDPFALKSDAVRSLFWDRAGALWIGTDDAGVFRYDPRVQQFRVYQNNPSDNNSISSDPLFGIYEDQAGILWLGGMDGVLNRLDRKNNTVERISPDANKPRGLAPSRLLGPIIADRNGTIWLASRGGGGLHSYDTKSGLFTRYGTDPGDPRSISDNTIICVYEDRNGSIWAGTESGGLNRLNTTSGTFQRWTYNPDDPASLNSNHVRAIYEDNNGTFWIGTLGGGLNRFDIATGRFSAYLHDINDITSISNNQVLSLHEDRNGTLWVGTGQGLNAFDKNNTFRQYTEKDGLPNSCIYGILEDESGTIWVSTNNGIAALNQTTGRVSSFDRRDGVSSDEYNSGAFFTSHDGEMFFGGINGLTSFYPNQIRPNAFIPPVVLTGFELANKPVPINTSSLLKTSITKAPALTLSYLDNVFSFEFSALNFADPQENRYRYRLFGFEPEWNEVGSDRRIATYTSLTPGVYTFRVQGSNNDGIWNETGVALNVEITPPWWDTWWFKAILLIIIAGLLFTLYRVRVQSLKRRSEELEQLVKVRTHELEQEKERAERANMAKSSFMASMSHELRTPLNAILGYAQILSTQINLTEVQRDHISTIRHSGEHLLNLINDILDMGRIESHRMELSEAPFRLAALVDLITKIISVKADEKGLILHVETAGDLPEFVNGDERRIKQIMINLLTNAVRYTSQGTITLRIAYTPGDPGTFGITVSDTGIGIPLDKQEEIFRPFTRLPGEGRSGDGVGLGLAITRELVRMMNGTISVTSSPGAGSIFTALIPLKVAGGGEEISPHENIEGYSGERKTILVVDDNVTNVILLRTLLVPLGFTVLEATGGEQALHIAGEERVDLVLLDLVMPQIDGVEVAERIHDGSKPSPKIIGISATLTSLEKRDRFIRACDDFIAKPFIVETLLEKIRSALEISWVKTPGHGTGGEHPPELVSDERIPPDEILNSLAAAAESGDFRRVEEMTAACLTRDPAYRSFCMTIRGYTARYDDDGLIAWIGTLREKNSVGE